VSSKRIEWVDIYKGIMIILVVIGHATGQFNSWIYQFHMAAFFFISGYLSKIEKKNDISVLIKKAITLLFPFFSLSIFGIICNAILNRYGLYQLLFGGSFPGIVFSMKQLFYYGIGYVQYWGTFWFLVALFGVEVFETILCRTMNSKVNLIFIFVSICAYLGGYWLIANGVNHNIWIININHVLVMQVFYLSGILCKKYNLYEVLFGKSLFGEIGILLVAIGVAIWAKSNSVVVDIASLSCERPIAEYITAISSIYIILFFSYLISKYLNRMKHIFIICGKNSLGIMTLHFVFFKLFMVFLLLIGIASPSEITNVVLTKNLSDDFWIPLTIYSLFGSLISWIILKKIPAVEILLGQDDEKNRIISKKIAEIQIIVKCEDKTNKSIETLWNKINNVFFEERNIIILCLIGIVLFSIPFYRTGIIINDELQARCLAMQGFIAFYKSEFIGWADQGRLLAAPINSFTKYLGFIGVGYGTAFRIGSITIILLTILAYGRFVNNLIKDRYFAVFSSVFAVSFLAITFEHQPPNAFVGFLSFPLMLLFISLNCFVTYIEQNKARHIILSMILFLIAMMSYEAFVTYSILFILIAFGLTNIRTKSTNLTAYFAPIITTLLYLVSYCACSFFSPSDYAGNQIGFNNLWESLKIIVDLFLVCIPGFFVAFPRYQYFRELFYNFDCFDFTRVSIFVVLFGIVCMELFEKKSKNSKLGNQSLKISKLYIVFCSFLYMIIPSIPNALSRMYQGNVGFTSGFLTLPVSYFEYFSAIFLFTFIIWSNASKLDKKYRIIITVILCVCVLNIQEMNDIFSHQQNQDFNRITKIESFLQTKTVKSLPIGDYYAPDFYQQNNLLVIHDGYWSDFCNNVLQEKIQISKDYSEDIVGSMYYDNDNFTIVNNNKIIVASLDREFGTKAVPIADAEYYLFSFEEEMEDNGYYIYSMKNESKTNYKESYAANWGYNVDGWLEKDSSFTIQTGEIGRVHLTVFYPGKIFEDKVITIEVNNSFERNVILLQNETQIDIDVEPLSIVSLNIKCNFEYEDKGSDIRPIAILMTNLSIE